MTTNAAINIEAGPPRRRLILALGRGKSGKTIWARWLTEVMRVRGVNPVVVDADTDDGGLCRYEEGVARLCGHEGEEVAWWDAVLADSEDRIGRPVVVDCSHNPGLIDRVHSEATGFRDRDFRDRYAEIGFDVTKVYFFAPDGGDADAFVTNGARVTAADTLLVLNEGVLGERGSCRFDSVLAHPAVREAIDHGAHVARMPALRADLAADREITSLIAFSKLGVPGQEPLSFKRVTMRTWLDRMETAFSRFGRELGLG
jgi:hypothetical protein